MIDCLYGVLNLGIQMYQMNTFCTILCMLLVQLVLTQGALMQ